MDNKTILDMTTNAIWLSHSTVFKQPLWEQIKTHQSVHTQAKEKSKTKATSTHTQQASLSFQRFLFSARLWCLLALKVDVDGSDNNLTNELRCFEKAQ